MYTETSGWFYVTSGNSVVIKNLTLNGEGKTINTAIQSKGNVIIEDCLIKNIYANKYFGFGIQLLSGENNEITRCEFENIERVGIHVRGSKGGSTEPIAVIKDSKYTGRGEGDYLEYGIEFGGGGSGTVDGFNVSNVLGTESGWTSGGIMATTLYGAGTGVNIIDSTFSNNVIGIIIGYDDEDTTTLTATNNNFVQNDIQIRAKDAVIFDFEEALTENTFDRAVVVRYGANYPQTRTLGLENGSNDGKIKVLTIFSNINDAMEKAESYDVVEVLPGTYEEDVNLEKQGIILKSRDGSSDTTIKGDTISFKHDGVTLEGFTIDNNGGDRAIGPRGTSGGLIKDNVIKNSFRGIQGDWYGRPTNLTIIGNHLETNYGIAGTEDMTKLTVKNNVFDTTEEGMGIGGGIEISLMEGNQFSGTGVYVKDYREPFDSNELEDIFLNNTFPGNAAIVENTIVLVIPAPTLPGGGGPINTTPPTTGGGETEGDDETEGEVLGEMDSRDYKEQEEEKEGELDKLKNDKERLGGIKDVINTLLGNIDDEEKENILREVLERLSEMEESLDEEIEALEEALEEIIEKRALSEQKEKAEQAEEAINKLLDESDLTEEQRSSFEDILGRLEELRNRIEERLNQ
jgi:hypothetical protein